MGLLINVVVYNFVIYFFDLNIKVYAQAIGILTGMALNFFGSLLFVFSENKRLNLKDQNDISSNKIRCK
jgi:putative flippase GtrA